MSAKTNVHIHRARVAALARYREASDPALAEARHQMAEQKFVAAVERALAKAPPITPQVRDQVIALLTIPGETSSAA